MIIYSTSNNLSPNKISGLVKAHFSAPFLNNISSLFFSLLDRSNHSQPLMQRLLLGISAKANCPNVTS